MSKFTLVFALLAAALLGALATVTQAVVVPCQVPISLIQVTYDFTTNSTFLIYEIGTVSTTGCDFVSATISVPCYAGAAGPGGDLLSFSTSGDCDFAVNVNGSVTFECSPPLDGSSTDNFLQVQLRGPANIGNVNVLETTTDGVTNTTSTLTISGPTCPRPNLATSCGSFTLLPLPPGLVSSSPAPSM